MHSTQIQLREPMDAAMLLDMIALTALALIANSLPPFEEKKSQLSFTSLKNEKKTWKYR